MKSFFNASNRGHVIGNGTVGALVTWLEKYGRWLAVLAVGAVSVLVLWVVLGMLKRQTG